MGWLFSNSWTAKNDLIIHLQRPLRFGVNKLIASRVVGMHHWYVVETPAGSRVIGLDLMQSGTIHSPCWGYKDLDETVGPNAVDCPMALLNLATEPDGDNARQWRQHVISYHEKVSERDKKKRALSAGSCLMYGGVEYRLVRPAGSRKGWVVERTRDGQTFRMSDKQISQALSLAE